MKKYLRATLFWPMLALIVLLIPVTLFAQKHAEGPSSATATFTNFNEKGEQVTRFSCAGEAIDAHDGEIALFDGMYYLYGTSYDCGFQWGKKDAPFCGFKVYSSRDMVSWTDRGFLFDAAKPVWQTRCNGATYGCFRPHVIFNKKTSLYILWINVYDNRVGFRVFTAKNPTGPFTEVAEPRLAVNADSPVAGLNNGDHDTFVDDDGTAYVAYTDWRTKGTIVIEKLNPDYLSGTGVHVKAVTTGNTEAPSLFKRGSKYYITYSDPNCGYCSGTGTSYKTAASPLGPWSEGISISNNSCGGQPSFVSPIKLPSGVIYLYGSDLWNNAAKNEALANYYWAPLSFADDGAIQPMICLQTVTIPVKQGIKKKALSAELDNTSGLEGFRTHGDIRKGTWRSQSFVAKRSGLLNRVSFTTFKNGDPDAALLLEIYAASDAGIPEGQPLSSAVVAAGSVGWAANYITVEPKCRVTAGRSYTIVLKSNTTSGFYGFAFNDGLKDEGRKSAYSTDGGHTYAVDERRTLMFQTYVREAMK
ncbi:family 43 glycosylhydrolase [Pedobacter hartonius]|uniref:Glycosyl hydrolases family 43 n=1 Tax=Pedobacter hartonius TaxID=425514 RepID=A0A1H4BN78_9SPHI|nr:family 43 glycosylhydrolase [Pedobacter hartonius]SEA49262.1 Glycosyl hydrolases family 43 [Pedobacter hartonius]